MEFTDFLTDSRAWITSRPAELEPATTDLTEIVKVAVEHVHGQTGHTSATSRTIWRDPAAHAVTLVSMLVDRYGSSCLEWLPETLEATLKKDGIVVSNANWTKILAARPLTTNMAPWFRWHVFHWIALGLSGTAPNFEFLEEPRLGHLVHAVNVMKIFAPRQEFGDEVARYIAATLRMESVFHAPSPVEFAQDELEMTKIICRTCNARHRDDGDVKCVTCGSKQLEREPFEWADLRDKTKTGFEARRALPLAKAVDGLGHDSVGNAVYALLTNWDYAQDQRLALEAQLRMLRSA